MRPFLDVFQTLTLSSSLFSIYYFLLAPHAVAMYIEVRNDGSRSNFSLLYTKGRLGAPVRRGHLAAVVKDVDAVAHNRPVKDVGAQALEGEGSELLGVALIFRMSSYPSTTGIRSAANRSCSLALSCSIRICVICFQNSRTKGFI